MTRTAAHYLYVSSAEIIKNGVVERNEQGIVTGIFSLDDHRIETEQTIFHSGIIAAVPHLSKIKKLLANATSPLSRGLETDIFELLAKMNLPPIQIGEKADLVLINSAMRITQI